jgi:type I restriction enzyme S subunit
MVEWKETDFGRIPIEWDLKKIIEIKANSKSAVAMGPFGSNIKAENFVETGIPVIRGTNLNYDKYVGGKFVYLTEDKANELIGSNCVPGDIVFTHRGTIGQVGLIPKNKHKRYVISQSGMKLTVNPDLMDCEFLFYFFKSEFGQYQILKYESQVGVPSISNPLTSLKEMQVPVPKLTEQIKIAKVLSSLDDKIDLLNRQNITLEALAETLFRQWFVEEAKEEWEIGTLEQLVDSANTGLDAIKRAPIVEEDTGIKCLRIQDISQGKPMQNWGNSKVTNNDFEKARLRKGDIIMARTCSPGIVFYAREDFNAVFNNGLARIRPNREKTFSIFLYYLFKTDDFIGHIYGISDGTSVQLNMKLGDLLSYKIQFPPKFLQDTYYPTFQAIDNKIYSNIKQIHTLTEIRDALLPKLLSGEVRVQTN